MRNQRPFSHEGLENTYGEFVLHDSCCEKNENISSSRFASYGRNEIVCTEQLLMLQASYFLPLTNTLWFSGDNYHYSFQCSKPVVKVINGRDREYKNKELEWKIVDTNGGRQEWFPITIPILVIVVVSTSAGILI